MADKNRGTFLSGIFIGTTLGTITGLLLASRQGRDTRKVLGKTIAAVPQMAEDISSSVILQADKLSAAAGDRWHDTLDRLTTAISAGIVASQSARESNSVDLPKSIREIDDR
ncbi:YtxH domain-containing protein [Chamaesiphon sp. GL140_3_metabinner_50]|uniref:YtxH domain-containing protein n=1 Tax=Chamaesiphon sp. GL140_3_metabinner_50 TaxID=2970812 RepID=UPI0025F4407E|nr:YtxH domain-containing protein [Chamaesiphon sp. GL140_3_metabinner_50]